MTTPATFHSISPSCRRAISRDEVVIPVLIRFYVSIFSKSLCNSVARIEMKRKNNQLHTMLCVRSILLALCASFCSFFVFQPTLSNSALFYYLLLSTQFQFFFHLVFWLCYSCQTTKFGKRNNKNY